MSMCATYVEMGGQLEGVSSLLPPGSQESHLGLTDSTLSTEPF